MEQEIVDYIIQAQKHGLAEFEIKQNLLSAGWDGTVVEENFVFAKAAENRPASMGQNEHQQTSVAENAASSILPNRIANPVSSQPQQSPLAQTIHSNLTISENTFQSGSSSANIFKNKYFWIILIILVAFGGAAYGYYSYFYITPARIFNFYLSAKNFPVSKINYELNYSFNYESDNASTSQPVTLTVSGDSYTDLTSTSSPEGSGNVKFSGSFGPDNASTAIKYLLLKDVFYLYIGDIKKAAGVTAGYPDWLKLDLSQVQKTLEKSGTQNSSSSPFDNPALVAKIRAIAQKAEIIKTTNYLAKEQINGISTYHIQNQLDTAALNKFVSDTIDAIQNDPSYTETKITPEQKQALSSVIAKFQVKNFDLWIGQKDHLLYKVHIVTNFPSFSDMAKSSLVDSTFLGATKEKSREAKRLADVRQTSAALELFYNDHGGYPEGINGIPQSLTPTYIGAWPEAPSPADGTCTDYYNTYWYQPQGSAKIIKGIKVYQSYALTFCLGSAVGGYKAGIGQLTEQGIKDSLACPATQDLCINSSPQSGKQDIQSAIDKIGFNDELKIDITYSDYGKTEKLEPPASSQDLLQLFNQFGGSLSLFNQSSVIPLAQQTSLIISTLSKIGSRN